jgi:hypothetical protein
MTRVLLLLLALIAFAVACGGGDDDNEAVSPQVAARERFADDQAALGFLRPPVPHYIPPAVSQNGNVLNDATATHILVSYPPIGATGAPTDATAPFLTIVANLEPNGVQPCTASAGPAPYAVQCIDVLGEPSLLQVTPEAATANAFLATRIGDLSVFVTLDWPATSDHDVPAAEQAKAQVLQVAQELVTD